MNLPYTKSDTWPIRVNLSSSDWQWLSSMSAKVRFLHFQPENLLPTSEASFSGKLFEELSQIVVTRDEVLEWTDKSKKTASDGKVQIIYTWAYLKSSNMKFALFLLKVGNLSLKSASTLDWKTVNVVLVFKNKIWGVSENYRTISLKEKNNTWIVLLK